jgi:hypothetical protein
LERELVGRDSVGAVRAIIDKCVVHDHEARYKDVLTIFKMSRRGHPTWPQ